MKLWFRQLCTCPTKSLGKKRNMRRRRLKLLVPTRRNSILCPNPTTSSIYLPLDLQINILLRAPVKSLLRFRYVSKLWSSIITSQDFRNQQLNIAPPRLLITFKDFDGNKLLLVSSPNPNPNPNPNAYSSSIIPYRDLNLVEIRDGSDMFNLVRGLICVGGRKEIGICNPSTGQLHIFPRIKYSCDYFLGYDPIEDQYKILAVLRRLGHKVLVLGGREKESWREVPCVAYPYIVHTRGLYMNGTIYYGAERTDIDSPNNNSIIVSFDVRSETFNVIKVPSKVIPEGYENMWIDSIWATDKTLINYEGKIGVVEGPFRDGSFRLWIVEDAAKEEWSMNTFHLPKSLAGLEFFNVMDTTFHAGEICLVPTEISDPFRFFYYNLKKKSMRSVVIEGLPLSDLESQNLSVTISDHCESFMLPEGTKKHHELYVVRREAS